MGDVRASPGKRLRWKPGLQLLGASSAVRLQHINQHLCLQLSLLHGMSGRAGLLGKTQNFPAGSIVLVGWWDVSVLIKPQQIAQKDRKVVYHYHVLVCFSGNRCSYLFGGSDHLPQSGDAQTAKVRSSMLRKHGRERLQKQLFRHCPSMCTNYIIIIPLADLLWHCFVDGCLICSKHTEFLCSLRFTGRVFRLMEVYRISTCWQFWTPNVKENQRQGSEANLGG